MRPGAHRSRPELPIDGRVARGRKIREATLRAMLDLIREGNLHPIAAEIAQRARVSVRAIFNHFKDVETLRAAAIELQEQEEAELLTPPIPPDLPLEDRIRAFVDQRAGFLEAVSPFRRTANASAQFSPQVSAGLLRARQRTRKQIEEVFGRELAALGRTDRAELLAMLVVASSWPTWDTLRTPLGMSPKQAHDVMAEQLRRILQPMLTRTRSPRTSSRAR